MDETQTAEEAQTSQTPAGEIKYVAVLDLTGFTTPEEVAAITRISYVAVVLAPESLMPAVLRIPMDKVASVVPVPAGRNVKIMAGQAQITGEALANPGGDPDDIYLIAGQLIITTPVQSVGYKQLIVAGQVLAPTGSEAALGAGITRQTGQVIYYPPGARIFIGEDRFSAAFFELLDEPLTMLLVGDYRIAPDVTVELLRAKVRRILLVGELHAPAALVPILQVLTTDKFGEISVDIIDD
jgi:hypothetical protein